MIECTISPGRVDERTVFVRLEGRVDLHAAPELKRVLLEAAGVRGVVVDLTDAQLFDSTTLGVLLAAERRLAACGSTLTVICGGALLALIRRTGLDGLLDVVPADLPAPVLAHA